MLTHDEGREATLQGGDEGFEATQAANVAQRREAQLRKIASRVTAWLRSDDNLMEVVMNEAYESGLLPEPSDDEDADYEDVLVLADEILKHVGLELASLVENEESEQEEAES